jgi:hypothetical protein
MSYLLQAAGRERAASGDRGELRQMELDRREFIATMAAVPALGALQARPIPDYRVVTKYKPAAQPGMPGLYPGRVVTVHSPRCIDEVSEQVDVPTVKEMDARGMATLTGDKEPRDSWARFFNAQDFVGIKINASSAPGAMSMPDVVAEIARNLMTVGVKPTQIVIHERGGGQILLAKYDQFVLAGVRVESANTWLGFDPDAYVEANFLSLLSEADEVRDREPGHIQYASMLGLGVYDLNTINHTEITV